MNPEHRRLIGLPRRPGGFARGKERRRRRIPVVLMLPKCGGSDGERQNSDSEPVL
jgi:hypothetical protein